MVIRVSDEIRVLTAEEKRDLWLLQTGRLHNPDRLRYLDALDRAVTARTELLLAEQRAQLGAQELEAWRGAHERLARAKAELAGAARAEEARRREGAERSAGQTAIVPPAPGDFEVRGLLRQLDRRYLPEVWERVLREQGDPVSQRALRHLGWLRQVRREGSQV